MAQKLRKTNKNGREMDFQRQKVYDAEGVLPAKATRDLARITASHEFAKNIITSTWFKNRFGPVTLRTHDGRGRRNAGGVGRRYQGHTEINLYLPRWARSQTVIIHEIAHGCVGALYEYYAAQRDSKLPSWHGPEFCHIYLELVGRFMGSEEKKKLKASFRKHKVKFTPRHQILEPIIPGS